MLWVWEWSLQIYNFTIVCALDRLLAANFQMLLSLYISWSGVPEKGLPVPSVEGRDLAARVMGGEGGVRVGGGFCIQ